MNACVYWITGLSGSGKTTLGRALCRRLRQSGKQAVMVDGDDIRQLLGRQSAENMYSLAARRQLAELIQRLCGWLAQQDVNVVCCTISAFPDIRNGNRDIFDSYFEVFIDTPMHILKKRDNKSIYARAFAGELQNVIGVDLPFEAPANSDLRIENIAQDSNFPEPWVDKILELSVGST
jgi:cytidine diphosphoramidate kinase